MLSPVHPLQTTIVKLLHSTMKTYSSTCDLILLSAKLSTGHDHDFLRNQGDGNAHVVGGVSSDKVVDDITLSSLAAVNASSSPSRATLPPSRIAIRPSQEQQRDPRDQRAPLKNSNVALKSNMSALKISNKNLKHSNKALKKFNGFQLYSSLI